MGGCMLGWGLPGGSGYHRACPLLPIPVWLPVLVSIATDVRPHCLSQVTQIGGVDLEMHLASLGDFGKLALFMLRLLPALPGSL